MRGIETIRLVVVLEGVEFHRFDTSCKVRPVNECFNEAFRAGASPKLAVVGGWQQVASIVWIQVVGCPLIAGVQGWLSNGAE